MFSRGPSVVLLGNYDITEAPVSVFGGLNVHQLVPLRSFGCSLAGIATVKFYLFSLLHVWAASILCYKLAVPTDLLCPVVKEVVGKAGVVLASVLSLVPAVLPEMLDVPDLSVFPFTYNKVFRDAL